MLLWELRCDCVCVCWTSVWGGVHTFAGSFSFILLYYAYFIVFPLIVCLVLLFWRFGEEAGHKMGVLPWQLGSAETQNILELPAHSSGTSAPITASESLTSQHDVTSGLWNTSVMTSWCSPPIGPELLLFFCPCQVVVSVFVVSGTNLRLYLQTTRWQ